jgi:aspartyl-tRNA(Asn)/glutamyl-tRNA(Gln) amidotransferase subunit A
LEAFTSLGEVQATLRSGAINCTQLVDYCLENIQKHTHLNAFLEVYDQEARTRASEIDQKIKQGTAGKLAGLVVGLKDVLCHQHHPAQAGSRILEGFKSQFSATAVQRLIAEDAIIIGRQNCDEFGMGSTNENSAYGAVSNGLDPSRVPGGSSGGSAVAVQMGMCHVSLGSDTGGSVRQPAAFTGVVGLKPTYSRISRHGLIAYASSFDTIGVLSRSVEDNARVLEVIAGADEYDSTVSKQDVPSFSQLLDQPQTYRIAYFNETLQHPGLQEEVYQQTIKKIESLKSQGHTVEAVDFPLLEYALPTYYILTTAEASSNLSRFDGVKYGPSPAHQTNLDDFYKQNRTNGFGPEVLRRIMLGTFVLSASYYDAYYTKAQKVRRMIKEQIKSLFKTYDFIVLPTAPTTAYAKESFTDNPVEMYLADLYTVQASVAGGPALSIPNGTDQNGMPIGFQIMADDFKELDLYQFAKSILNNHLN